MEFGPRRHFHPEYAQRHAAYPQRGQCQLCGTGAAGAVRHGRFLAFGAGCSAAGRRLGGAVHDLAGRLLVQRSVAVPVGLSALALPETGRLAAGVYVVRVLLNNEIQTLRVTRE